MAPKSKPAKYPQGDLGTSLVRAFTAGVSETCAVTKRAIVRSAALALWNHDHAETGLSAKYDAPTDTFTVYARVWDESVLTCTRRIPDEWAGTANFLDSLVGEIIIEVAETAIRQAHRFVPQPGFGEPVTRPPAWTGKPGADKPIAGSVWIPGHPDYALWVTDFADVRSQLLSQILTDSPRVFVQLVAPDYVACWNQAHGDSGFQFSVEPSSILDPETHICAHPTGMPGGVVEHVATDKQGTALEASAEIVKAMHRALHNSILGSVRRVATAAAQEFYGESSQSKAMLKFLGTLAVSESFTVYPRVTFRVTGEFRYLVGDYTSHSVAFDVENYGEIASAVREATLSIMRPEEKKPVDPKPDPTLDFAFHDGVDLVDLGEQATTLASDLLLRMGSSVKVDVKCTDRASHEAGCHWLTVTTSMRRAASDKAFSTSTTPWDIPPTASMAETVSAFAASAVLAVTSRVLHTTSATTPRRIVSPDPLHGSASLTATDMTNALSQYGATVVVADIEVSDDGHTHHVRMGVRPSRGDASKQFAVGASVDITHATPSKRFAEAAHEAFVNFVEAEFSLGVDDAIKGKGWKLSDNDVNVRVGSSPKTPVQVRVTLHGDAGSTMRVGPLRVNDLNSLREQAKAIVENALIAPAPEQPKPFDYRKGCDTLAAAIAALDGVRSCCRDVGSARGEVTFRLRFDDGTRASFTTKTPTEAGMVALADRLDRFARSF